MIKQKEITPDIKIFVVCHKPSYVPKNPYLYPIQVGTALAPLKLPGMFYDNDGDNISDKNKTYCELTAQYWAWKNIEADYYGFFHYRRYFSFDTNVDNEDIWGNIVYENISDKAIQEMKLYPEEMKKIITQYDAISVKGRKYPDLKGNGQKMDVYHEYGEASFQHRKDLDKTLEVLLNKYPKFKDITEQYMKSNKAHECNMFIMKKNIYKQYCSWLFDILFEVEKQIDTTWYSVEEYRVMGYLAERLCGLYFEYLKKQPEIKTKELSKTLFRDTTPKSILKPVYENGIPIVFSANDRFSPYLDVMIRSIEKNSSDKKNYDIIVLYNDISEKNQKLIKTSSRENISIRFIRVSDYFDAKELFVDQHLSIETYYRLIIPEIMPDYNKILYLDCDMVTDCDVAELYELDLEENIVGAAKDIDVAGQLNLDQNGWKEYAENILKLDSPYDYFQAGVLVIDLDKLRETTSSKEMIRLAVSQKFRCHDQDVLNIVCKNKVKYIPQAWNTLMDWKEVGRSRMDILKMAPRKLYEEYLEARKEPYIIHYAGYQKPWDVVDCDFSEFFWKYAKKSPYYTLLIYHIKQCLFDKFNVPEVENREENVIVENAYIEKESFIRRISAVFFPYKSRRREYLKKVIKKIIHI